MLRVDIPTNYKVDSERGIRLAVQPTEIAPKGIRMQLFIDQVNNPTAQLDGKDPVVDLTGDGLVPNKPSIANLPYNMQQMQKALMMKKLGG